MNHEWIVAVIVILAIVGSATATAVVLLNHYGKQESIEQPRCGRWMVELWNIRHGFRVDLQFQNNIVVGRYSLYSPAAQMRNVEPDNCISREHLMLYDQGGVLWVWNLSTVNPAQINGHRLDSAQRIIPGMRLELGNSVFLVTKVEFATMNQPL